MFLLTQNPDWHRYTKYTPDFRSIFQDQNGHQNTRFVENSSKHPNHRIKVILFLNQKAGTAQNQFTDTFHLQRVSKIGFLTHVHDNVYRKSQK